MNDTDNLPIQDLVFDDKDNRVNVYDSSRIKFIYRKLKISILRHRTVVKGEDLMQQAAGK